MLIYSQQQSYLTLYRYQMNIINPAYAGSRETLSVIGLHRSQWVGLEGGPQTQTLSIHAPLRNEKVGLGLSVINDELGFENFQYVYNAGNPDFIAILRSFTAIPLHACCGIIMGYYFGLYIFKDRNKLNLFKSLFFAISFHATYNYFATRNVLLMFIVLIILISFARKLHKLLKIEQLSKQD